MSSMFIFDTETSGLSVDHHALIELAGVAIADGEVLGEICVRMKPHEGAKIDPEALKINGYSYEEIMQWPDINESLDKFVEWIDSHERKFSLAGHNVGFDSKFLYRAFCRTGRYGDHVTRFRSNSKDTYTMAKTIGKRVLKCEDFKLGTLCKYFEIPLERAHSALDDARATYQLYLKLEALMPKLAPEQDFHGSYQQKRRKYLDSKYIIRNPDGSVYLTENWASDRQAREFILSELWELEKDD